LTLPSIRKEAKISQAMNKTDRVAAAKQMGGKIGNGKNTLLILFLE
jgi:hypothetical protein